jgi:hypothetical protein
MKNYHIFGLLSKDREDGLFADRVGHGRRNDGEEMGSVRETKNAVAFLFKKSSPGSFS